MKTTFFRPFCEDFIGFLGKSFLHLSPAERFMMNWHLDVIGEHLQAVQQGEIKRLMINVPPRSLKSVMVSVAWPAWLLGHNPCTKIMAASYAQSLANKHSMDCRSVMQSAWYQRLFPNTVLSKVQNEKHKFLTTQHGMRMATSIWGSATGEGADILIADDPMNPLQAQSAVTRRYIHDWFDHTFTTRLNNKRTGAMVLVMQRLHDDDLCGHLLRKGGWELLCLPAIATASECWKLSSGTVRREVGAVLHEAREDAALIERAKQELGANAFAAQYQQKPICEQSAMLQLEWFARFDV